MNVCVAVCVCLFITFTGIAFYPVIMCHFPSVVVSFVIDSSAVSCPQGPVSEINHRSLCRVVVKLVRSFAPV